MFGILSLETRSLTCITVCNHRFMKENLNWMNLFMYGCIKIIYFVGWDVHVMCVWKYEDQLSLRAGIILHHVGPKIGVRPSGRVVGAFKQSCVLWA